MAEEEKDNQKSMTNLSFVNNLNKKNGMANLEINFNKKEKQNVTFLFLFSLETDRHRQQEICRQ